jgi:tetratricopeptide (TPR) repeat protein
VIREDEASTLHSKLTSLGEEAREIAERRSAGLAALRKELAGDLNWITMKAVEKDRQRRYSTAAELAADIHRYLENRPVLAGPPSRLYRMRKFVRRNRLPVLAGAVAAAALVAGFAAAIWQARIAQRERAVAVQQRGVAEARGREALAQRQHAEEEAANARRQEEAAERQKAIAESRLDDVSALANSMLFEVDDRVKELPGSTAAREVLMRRGLDYVTRMSEQTPDSARLRAQLGAAYLKMGELQWAPDGSNLRDVNGARNSYAQSAALLEKEVQADPGNAELRHRLTLAYLRHAQLLDSDREQQAGYERAMQSAKKLEAATNSVEAKDDLAEVYQAKQDFERATEMRKEIVAASPKDAGARWKLYTAQFRLGASLLQKDDARALELLNGVTDGLDALHANDPANVPYQRYRGLTRAYLGMELLLHNRYADGAAKAREGAAIQAEVAAADPHNASLQLDLSSAESLLGTILVVEGQITEGMQHFQKALAIQEEEAAAHPENTDFALAAARLHNAIAAMTTVASRDRAGALKHRQAAAALYRTLVQDHPGRAVFALSLAAELTAVGDAQLGSGDRTGAVGTYREGVKAAERLGTGGQPTDEEWTVKGDAHAGLARGATAVNLTAEAIAEDRAAIACYMRVSAGSATAKAVRRLLSSAWAHLSADYSARADYKSAVEATLKALPYAEADYAEAPSSPVAARYLWNTLATLRNNYGSLGDTGRAVDTARRGVEITDKLVALQPGDYDRIALASLSYASLGSALRSAGKREESLASYRQSAAALDAKPMEKLETAPLRRDWSDSYLNAIRGFTLWGEPQEALPASRRVIPVMEAVHKAEPNNEAYRAALVTAYRAVETALLDSGAVEEGLGIARKILETENANPRRDATLWLNLGLTEARIGSLEARSGDAVGAREAWRGALNWFEKGRLDATKAYAEHGEDRTSLERVALAEQRLGLMHEVLGDPTEALRRLREAIAHLAALVDSDSSNQSWARLLRGVRAMAARLESLGGQTAPSSDEVARGWKEHAGVLGLIEYPFPQRIEAAQRAVDLARQGSQVDLADALGQLGHFQYQSAVFAPAAERTNVLHTSEKSYREAQRILTALDKTASLPEESRTVLGDAVNFLATIAAKLGETNAGNQ